MPKVDPEERSFIQKRRAENKEMSDLADSGDLSAEKITVGQFLKFALTRNLSPEMRILLAKRAGLISQDEDVSSDKFPSIFNSQQ